MPYVQENTPKCKNVDASRLQYLINALEIPNHIIKDSFKLYRHMVDVGYPKDLIVFLGCFSIKQKLHMDEPILMLDMAKYFNVCMNTLRETERRILLKIK